MPEQPRPRITRQDVVRAYRWVREIAEEYPSVGYMLEEGEPGDNDISLVASEDESDDADAPTWWGKIETVLEAAQGLAEKAPTRRQRESALRDIQRAGKKRTDALVDRLERGESIEEFQIDFKNAIKDFHIAASVASKGSWSVMTKADWGRVGNRVRKQYEYADKFVLELLGKQADEGPSFAQIKARASLYVDAISATFHAQEAQNAGINPGVLGVFPGDGSTECRTRCKCRWTIRVLNAQRGDFNARWTLGSAEHCKTCLARGRAWRIIRVRGNRLVAPLPSV